MSESNPAHPPTPGGGRARRLLDHARASSFYRLFKFGLVGGSGVVVNQGLLWLGVTTFFVTLPERQAVAVASVLAIVVSIITNFILNDVWTWGDRAKRSPLHARFGKYALVASVAGVVQWVVLQSLVHFGFHYLGANFIGIGAGIVINYAVNNWWTFRAVEVAEASDDAADERLGDAEGGASDPVTAVAGVVR